MQTAKRKVEELYKEFKRSGTEEPEELEYRQAARDAIKKLLEAAMSNEIRVHVGASRYERSSGRLDSLNGGYMRHLLTEVGEIEIRVPRSRRGGFRSEAVEAYRRRGKNADLLIVGCFVNGLSTRKAARVVGRMLGSSISASTVSRIAKMLDGEVKRYHWRKLKDGYKYLFFDGVTLKERCLVETVKRSVLTAYGITHANEREIIDFRISGSESEAQWERFLTGLFERGLVGASTKLIVTDGGKGLHKALDTVYGHIPRQACWAHRSRNVLDKTRKRDREKMRKELGRISHAAHRKEAVKNYWAFMNNWEKKYPRAVSSLKRDFDRLLIYMETPKKDWNKVRTTNAIERIFREVRRRTRPMGVCSNKQSLERILFAVFDNLNKIWQDTPLSFLHTK